MDVWVVQIPCKRPRMVQILGWFAVAFSNGGWALDMFGWFFQLPPSCHSQSSTTSQIEGCHQQLISWGSFWWMIRSSHDPAMDFIDVQIGEFFFVPDQSEILSPHCWWNHFHQDVIRFDSQGLFQAGMKHKWNDVFFRQKTMILSPQKIACQLQLHEPGVGPTGCISTWSLSHAQCWLEPKRLRGAGVSLVKMSQVGLLEVQTFQNLAVPGPKMRIFDFSSLLFFFCVCVCVCVWGVEDKISESGWSSNGWCPCPPQLQHFVCSMRTHGVGKAQFSCFHVILSYRWGPSRSIWTISPWTSGSWAFKHMAGKRMHSSMQLALAIGSRAAKQFSSLWRGWHRWLGIKHVLADFKHVLPTSPRVRLLVPPSPALPVLSVFTRSF